MTIVLLMIGVALQHLMIPLMILGIFLVLYLIRISICKCPGCGKTLPYSLRKIKVCPYCGLKLERRINMGSLGMLGVIVLSVFVILVYFIVTGIKQKSRKRVIFPIVCFVVFIISMILGLMFFIKSM